MLTSASYNSELFVTSKSNVDLSPTMDKSFVPYVIVFPSADIAVVDISVPSNVALVNFTSKSASLAVIPTFPLMYNC